ncbi:MAG: aromatic ring-hydroxylating dioxygenase subunit alpha [Pseudomonadota bacterium]
MKYVRSAWYVAGWSQDLATESPLAITILGQSIVVWRSGSSVVAMEDRCVHRLAPLSLGRCEEGHLRCMYHGFLYDRSGQVVQIPGQSTVPPNARVRTFAVAERHSWIWVWMGDPALADPATIPPAVGFDDPDWILGRGHLDYAAEAELINDNLLDFSHLTYVHANSFGAGPAFAEDRPKLTVLPLGVRFERWIVGTSGPALGSEPGAVVDAWSTYDFLVPGILLMWSGSFPAGTANTCAFEKPDCSLAISGVTFTSQAVTPMEDKAARYFFSWGPHRRHGDEALRDVLMTIAAKAFAEDKRIIEAQQRVIDRTPVVNVLPTAHDRGVRLFSQLVARMVRDESAAPVGEHAVANASLNGVANVSV